MVRNNVFLSLFFSYFFCSNVPLIIFAYVKYAILQKGNSSRKKVIPGPKQGYSGIPNSNTNIDDKTKFLLFLESLDSKNDDSKIKIGLTDSTLNVEYVRKNSRFEATLLSKKMAKN